MYACFHIVAYWRSNLENPFKESTIFLILLFPLYHSKVLSPKFLMDDMASDRAAGKNRIDVSISNRLG